MERPTLGIDFCGGKVDVSFAHELWVDARGARSDQRDSDLRGVSVVFALGFDLDPTAPACGKDGVPPRLRRLESLRERRQISEYDRLGRKVLENLFLDGLDAGYNPEAEGVSQCGSSGMRGCVTTTLDRAGFVVLCIGLPLSISGCWAVTAGAVVGVVAATDDDDGGQRNEPPVVDLAATPERIEEGFVVIRYFVLDDNPGPIEVRIEWQPEGGSDFFPLTEEQLEVEPLRRRDETVEWDAQEALESRMGVSLARVIIRVTAFDASKRSASVTSSGVWAGNDLPEIHFIEIDPDVPVDPRSGNPTGIIPLRVRFADPSSDPVFLSGRFRLLSEDEAGCMTFVGQTARTGVGGCGGSEAECEVGSSFGTSPEGIEHTLFWNSGVDIQTASSEVQLELSVRDAFDRNGCVTLRPEIFGIDNNRDPVVDLLGIPDPLDTSFEVPIRFTVQDAERHPVSVILQWELEGDLAPDPTGLDRDCLAKLLSGAEDAECFPEGVARARTEFHILSEADVLVRGSLDSSIGPLAADELQITALVREGLFVDGSHGSLLVGREICFEGNEDPQGGKDSEVVCSQILGFDPSTSIVTLADDVGGPLRGGRPFVMKANQQGVVLLPSESDTGLLYTFVWDSLRDLSSSRIALNDSIRILARGVDSEAGLVNSLVLQVESSLLRRVIDLPTDSGPSGVAVGDLNGDGRDDITVANRRGNSVTVMSGTDTLPAEECVVKGEPLERPVSVALGDADSIGQKDILVANSFADTFTVLHGGCAQEGIAVVATGTHPKWMVMNDIEGDGQDEVVVANFEDKTISVYFRDAKSGLQPLSSPLEAPESPDSVAIEDIVDDRDGDGQTDSVKEIVVVGWDIGGPGDARNVRRNAARIYFPQRLDGSLDFADFEDLTPGEGSEAVACGDFNSDGRKDIVVANRFGGENGSGSISLFLQESPGAERSYPASSNREVGTDPFPTSVGAFDADGDGRDDIVVTCFGAAKLNVFLQEDDGIGSAKTTEVETPFGPRHLAIGDLNSDGWRDVIVSHFNAATVGVYETLFAGQIAIDRRAEISTGGPVDSVAMGDINADGRNDLVVTVAGGKLLRYSLTFEGELPRLPVQVVSLPSGLSGPVALGDVDGDGRNDAVVVESKVAFEGDAPCEARVVHVFRQEEDGLLKEPSELPLGEVCPRSVAVKDVNSDGRNDVVVLGLSRVAIFLQTPDQILADPVVWAVELLNKENCLVASTIEDLDGDGHHDLVLFERDCGERPETEARLHVFFQRCGKECSLFESPPLELSATGRLSQNVAAGDLDGNGLADLVLAPFVYLQKERGSFKGQPEEKNPGQWVWVLETSDSRVNWAAVNDFNADGRSDVLVASGDTQRANLYFQRDDGILGIGPRDSVRPNQTLDLGQIASSLVVGDLNGDGRADVITALELGTVLGVFPGR